MRKNKRPSLQRRLQLKEVGVNLTSKMVEKKKIPKKAKMAATPKGTGPSGKGVVIPTKETIHNGLTFASLREQAPWIQNYSPRNLTRSDCWQN
ncbi:hypothetical protein NPIL_684191 [Nephila pilipes]|uniref:Uncharacterized protein n=1 Tax=Nephila pilipes TaxID=299642 RepID=A0A8X6MMQ3_NEPPI|nr:hypothetical protein NPIL_684191 [Nephila pilipes]